MSRVQNPFCCKECLEVFEYGLDDLVPVFLSTEQKDEIVVLLNKYDSNLEMIKKKERENENIIEKIRKIHPSL